MALTPEQHAQIAAVYDKCAADYMVPAPHRAAFARKAEMFRMLARLGAKPKSAPTPRTPQKASNPAKERGATLGNSGMLSAARHLFAWPDISLKHPHERRHRANQPGRHAGGKTATQAVLRAPAHDYRRVCLPFNAIRSPHFIGLFQSADRCPFSVGGLLCVEPRKHRRNADRW